MEDSENLKAHGGTLKNLINRCANENVFDDDEFARLPRINLNSRQLFDLELLLNGGFSPLVGFMDEKEYKGVVENMRLTDGTLWPMPIVLDLFSGAVNIGDRVLLCDPYGIPLAILTVSSIYKPDKEKEALAVYGTINKEHFGVGYLFERMEDTYVGGSLEGIQLPTYYDFCDIRLTPQETRRMFKEKGWNDIVAFQTRNPLHRAHFDLIKKVSEEEGANILIHPVVGETKDGDIDYVTRVKVYKALKDNYMSEFAELALLPLAMRMAGPREALWHAIIRKNYGCTHLIVGRDHAGCKDKKGKSFYGDYDAHDLLNKYSEELGIKVIPMKNMVFVQEKGCFIPENEVCEKDTTKKLSGTEFRRLVSKREKIPDWFSFPEVIDIIQRKHKISSAVGFTIFFTGLSGSGKSTISRIVETKLKEMTDREVTVLDGDIVRQNLSKGLTFSKEDRNINIERIGFVASQITKHGGIVLCSAIAPFKESRKNNREKISLEGEYIEVFVSASVDVCRKRDVKGLYAKADKGLIKNFTGVSDPYEAPEGPEITIQTQDCTPEEAANKVVDYLIDVGLVKVRS